MSWLPVARCDERHVVDGHAEHPVSDFPQNSDEVELLLFGNKGIEILLHKELMHIRTLTS